MTLCRETHSGFALHKLTPSWGQNHLKCRRMWGRGPSQTPKFLPPHPHSLATPKLNINLLNEILQISWFFARHLVRTRGAGGEASLQIINIETPPSLVGRGGWVKKFVRTRMLRTACVAKSTPTPHPPLRRSPFSRRRRSGRGKNFLQPMATCKAIVCTTRCSNNFCKLYVCLQNIQPLPRHPIPCLPYT